MLIAVAAQCFGVVALVGQQSFTAFARATRLARRNADFVQERLGVADITGLTARQKEAQRYPVGVAEHVNFGGQATATAT